MVITVNRSLQHSYEVGSAAAAKVARAKYAKSEGRILVCC